MNRALDPHLQDLVQKLVLIGRLTESMMGMALAALARHQADSKEHPGNDELAQKENEVDHLQLEIDALSVKLTALHQPVGADLRLLFMAPKIAEEFERVADLTVSMCAAMHRDLHLAPSSYYVDIRIMSEVAQRMIGDVIASLIDRDGAVIERIEKAEDEVNAFRDRILSDLTEGMSQGTVSIPVALSLITVSRSLERMGDHATNVAMEIAYIVCGRDVRHLAAPASRGDASKWQNKNF